MQYPSVKSELIRFNQTKQLHADEQCVTTNESTKSDPPADTGGMWDSLLETNSSVTHDLLRIMQLNRPALYLQLFRGEIIKDE